MKKAIILGQINAELLYLLLKIFEKYDVRCYTNLEFLNLTFDNFYKELIPTYNIIFYRGPSSALGLFSISQIPVNCDMLGHAKCRVICDYLTPIQFAINLHPNVVCVVWNSKQPYHLTIVFLRVVLNARIAENFREVCYDALPGVVLHPSKNIGSKYIDF